MRDFKGESHLFGSEIKFHRHLACCHFSYYHVQGDSNVFPKVRVRVEQLAEDTVVAMLYCLSSKIAHVFLRSAPTGPFILFCCKAWLILQDL